MKLLSSILLSAPLTRKVNANINIIFNNYFIAHIIILIFILVAIPANATWSSFAYVTPETENNYGLKIEVSKIENEKGKYRTKIFGITNDEMKQAWLIISSEKLTENEQNLRSYIWESIKPSKYILVKAKLNPNKSFSFETKKKPGHYEVDLSSVMMERAYIYIDFPVKVYDGGWYYSIDLPAYLARHREDQANSLDAKRR